MCNTITRQEKCTLVAQGVGFGVAMIYPLYSVVKAGQQLSLVNRVTDCVCSAFNMTASCGTDLIRIIGPGVSLSNVTSFCSDSSSLLQVAQSEATKQIATNVLFSGLILLGTVVMGKAYYTHFKNRAALTNRTDEEY